MASGKQKRIKNNMGNYHKLYTPEDSAVVFIDHEQMLFGVANADRASCAKEILVPCCKKR
jgi:hypothetical protein